jgi:hypothetical protein
MRCNLILLQKDLAAPQGFEPRYADPESAVLPLNEGAVLKSSEPACASPLILWSFDFMVQSEVRSTANGVHASDEG